MTFSQRAVEAAAEAMEQHMFAPHELPLNPELHAKYLANAKGALTAALAVDGVALLPVEPTNAMLDALAEECRFTWGVNVKTPKPCPLSFKSEWRERMKPLYRALISAASEGEERK